MRGLIVPAPALPCGPLLRDSRTFHMATSQMRFACLWGEPFSRGTTVSLPSYLEKGATHNDVIAWSRSTDGTNISRHPPTETLSRSLPSTYRHPHDGRRFFFLLFVVLARLEGKDFFYKEDWAKLSASDDLALHTAFSRSNPDGLGTRVYVQRRIREQVRLQKQPVP